MELEERIKVGGHDVTELVLERLQKMRALQVLEATKRIAKAAKAGGEARMLRDERGKAAGYVGMRIDPASYHYWGQRLGYGCWKDRQFCRDYLRDNEASRVKTISTRPMITAGFEGSKRWRKTYNDERKLAA